MKNKTKRIAGAAAAVGVAGTLITGGIHASAEHDVRPQTGISHEITTPSHQTTEAHKIIDARIALKYKKLPAAAQHAAAAAIAITVPEGRTTLYVNGKHEVVDMDPPPKAQGSGVVIKLPSGARAVLTAAHVSRPAESCGDLDVLTQKNASPGNLGVVAGVTHKSIDNQPPQDPVTKKYNADTVLLQPNLNDLTRGDFENIPAVQVQKTVKVKPGDVGFAINFEPTGKDENRSPLEDGKLSKPAEFSAMAITPVRKDGTFVALMGVGRSYGAVPDIDGRPGMSGGEYIGADGKLIGLTIAEDAVETPSELMTEYGVDVGSQDTGRKYDTAVIQTVDQAMVGRMVGEAAASAVCVPSPADIKPAT
jgi:hypothetical protein